MMFLDGYLGAETDKRHPCWYINILFVVDIVPTVCEEKGEGL